MSLNYYDMVRSKDKNFDVRLAMVKKARTEGIRKTAREFGASRNTVRLWLRRFEAGGPSALREKSRAPKSCPHKTSPYGERRIIESRHQAPCFGPRRLKDLFGLKPSVSAIARVLRQYGLTRQRRKKYKKKNDLRQIKALYKVGERFQMDTKPLKDIPAYWAFMKALGLPEHQYTIRDVKSGALFIDYAGSLSTTYAYLSFRRVAKHLERFGARLNGTILSTDNGGEFGGTERRERTYGFHAEAEALGVRHRFLPPRTPNAHGDVESSHAAIEAEFFDLESYRSRQDFWEKIRTYQLWWNYARPNYSKGGRTPAEIWEEEGGDPRCLLLPPTDLDELSRQTLIDPRVGQDVPVDTESWDEIFFKSKIIMIEFQLIQTWSRKA